MTIYSSSYAPVAVPDLSITDFVFQGTRKQADTAVLTCGMTGRSLTGAAFEDSVRRLAGGLTEHGFGAGHTVALMAPNIPEFAVVFHAVALAGGTITTINPTYTADEVRHQLKDSGAELLITIPDFLPVARAGITGTSVSEIAAIGGAEGVKGLDDLMGAPLDAQAAVDLDAHVVVLPYSSGTTGLPKGVMLSHRNLVANLVQAAVLIPVGQGETSLAMLPYFHIYGMQVVMNLYLARSASVVTMARFDLESFLTLAQKYKMERLFVVPPVMIALARHPLVDTVDLSSVRLIMSAAAPMGADLSEAVRQRLGCNVIQGYGMTELSPVSHACHPGDNKPGASGVLLPMTEARLVESETGQDAAPGEPGELWVRGPQVMLGYLNNDKATRSTIDADGWLHTGDIAKIDEKGYTYIVDRLKELIKFKGFQVAPAEIEALLVAHPGVADVAVVGQPHDDAGEVPVAFIVPATEGGVDLPTLQDYLKEHVASYKQVQRIIEIDAIPKSASGKILRRLLRDRLR
ncbi:AMP-binding protein [Flavimaricola marinus]|uniref:Long-chain-fatty-acid--CoA ligase n=1 Tax=Flavimaricola marinus TaxID=1819565 RepID=A0A238L8J8_9RHOB|nr:AMP-binding protein [Flavimaricola marinus]SMY06009.1 Long-chain-fatty-acid--CoA ligase [Flavimaricola marinus]